MYQPRHFQEADPERVHGLIAGFPFATLISSGAGAPGHPAAPCASHIPLLHDACAGPHGTLYGHLAAPNPQCEALRSGQRMLAIFHGPHAYVSPTWYEAQGVATWNYAAVHAYGTPRVLEAEDDKLALVDQLTAVNEAMADSGDGPGMDEAGRRRMLAGIVAFALPIDTLEAKFKLSQNRPVADQQRVLARLGQLEHPDGQALAGWMLENIVRGGGH